MKTLIIVVDIDDDLGRKAHIRGPLIGEKAVVEAATKLALSDPEDADANALFKAAKIYRDSKKKGKKVEIVALTGDKSLGLAATKRVASQLDTVLKEIDANSAFLVSDGVSDEVVLPLIESRLRLDGVDIVYVKQAKELEKTYFLLVEKLKDPTFAKYIFGIPAVLILLLSAMYLFSIPWQYLGFILGTWLLIKGFGIEEKMFEFFSFKEEDPGHLRIVSTTIFLTFLFIAFLASYFEYKERISVVEPLKAYIYSIDVFANFMGLFLFVVLILRLFNNYMKGNIYRTFNTMNYLITLIAILIVVKVAFKWILNDSAPYFTFEETLYISIGTFIGSYISYNYLRGLKKAVVTNTDLHGYEVYNIHGDYVGLISKKDERFFTVKNQLGKKEEIPLDKIIDIDDNRVTII